MANEMRLTPDRVVRFTKTKGEQWPLASSLTARARRWISTTRCWRRWGARLAAAGPGQPVPLGHCDRRRDSGYRRVQTREEFETFAAEQIGPLSAEAGFPAPPEITYHDVHNYDSADGLA